MASSTVDIKKESHDSGMVGGGSESHYPYGTGLRFENDMVDSLDLSKCAVGDKVEIHAVAFVESRSEYETKDGGDKSVSLQMTQIKVSKDEGDKADTLYGGND